MKVIQKGEVCYVRLFDPKTDASGNPNLVLFAEAPIRVDDKFKAKGIDFYVQKVVDSSRYFALRVEDAKSGRHAFLGVGFRERDSAFLFQSVSIALTNTCVFPFNGFVF